mmetsp:Transcript_101944/g.294975  ORF Transcript_101944/g.294975 Transcript_101944/m.294975 type:complete len:299 (-) Transcript_101944:55-951(-)
MLFKMISILFLVLFSVAMMESVLGQATFTDDDLNAMSDEELEQICIVRGFEILRDEIDPSTGLPYELNHDNFVEAARRCLEIEQEMNDLLAEYPELAAEVEEEIKKLEAEQKARQSEVEQLEKELAEAEAAAESASASSGAAFVPPGDTDDLQNAASDNVLSEEGAYQQEIVEEIDDAAADSNRNAGSNDSTNEEAVSDIIEDEVKESETNLASKNETAKEDFTISAMTFEIIRAVMKQVESDVKRIVELVAPVVRPILQAGDVAWRHIKVAFESLRRKYTEESEGGQRQEDETVAAA